MKNIVFDSTLSQRTFDSNGYLHIAMTPISKAMVCPYLGSELKAEGVDLEAGKIYYGLRDPEEIKKSVDTFNNLPVLNQHHSIDSTHIPKDYIIGTTGTDAEFDGKYLKNSMCIYDNSAIKKIEDGSQQEISCAYAFTPDFKSGTFTDEDGNEVAYDFVMKDLKGNHVALVEEGRAGHDVKVADSMPEVLEDAKKIPSNQIGEDKPFQWVTAHGRKILVNSETGEPVHKIQGQWQNTSHTATEKIKIGGEWAYKSFKNTYSTDTSDRTEKYKFTDVNGQKSGKNSLANNTNADGTLKPERERLHQTIIGEHFISPSGKPIPKPTGQPTYTFLGGGPAAGKSTTLKNPPPGITFPNQEDTVFLNSDDIKLKLPEKTKMAGEGNLDWPAYLHEESSALQKRTNQIALDEGYNILLDGTGDGSVKKMSKKIAEAKAKGMKVNGIYTTIDTDEAVNRSIGRALGDSGRKVDFEMLRQTHRNVSRILPEVADKFDEVLLYDNSGKSPILIARGGNGKKLTPEKGQEKLFQAFLDKGKITDEQIEQQKKQDERAFNTRKNEYGQTKAEQNNIPAWQRQKKRNIGNVKINAADALLKQKGKEMDKEVEIKDGGPGSGRKPGSKKSIPMGLRGQPLINKQTGLPTKQAGQKLVKLMSAKNKTEKWAGRNNIQSVDETPDKLKGKEVIMDEKDKVLQEEVQDENIDKKELIDEIGGILKDKVDEEVWRTIVGKIEEIAYNGSENTEADDEKEEEVKDEVEEEIAEAKEEQGEEHGDLEEKAEELKDAIQEHEGDDDEMFKDPMYRKGFEHGMAKAKQAVDDATPVMVQDTVAQVKEELTAQFRAMNKAAEKVKPLVGNIKDIMAFDSADGIYKFALDKNGINTKEYDSKAYKGMVDMLLKGKQKAKVMANDSVITSEEDNKLAELTKRLKNIH